VYHVQPLCIMCSLCVSCAASVYHVCVAPGFQGTRSPLCITCTQLYHILLLLLCTALKMLSGEINACNKHLFIYLYILCVVCGLSVQRSGSCTSDSAMCVCDNAQGISIQLLCILIDIALHSYRHWLIVWLYCMYRWLDVLAGPSLTRKAWLWSWLKRTWVIFGMLFFIR
jgi:hypothetical protein